MKGRGSSAVKPWVCVWKRGVYFFLRFHYLERGVLSQSTFAVFSCRHRKFLFSVIYQGEITAQAPVGHAAHTSEHWYDVMWDGRAGWSLWLCCY